jgi:uncharacterized protein YhdP
MTMSINTNLNKNITNTIFTIDSKILIKDLKKYLGLEFLDFISGNMNYHAVLSVPSAGTNNLLLSTNLIGTSINLPSPLGKTANARHYFMVDAKIDADLPPVIQLNYQGVISSVLGFKKTQQDLQIDRVGIQLGNGQATIPTSAGIFINGSIPAFSWETWLPVLTRYFGFGQSSSSHHSDLSLQQVNVYSQNINAYNQILNNAQFQLTQKNSSWAAKIHSLEIDGSIEIPKELNNGIIIGQFNTLKLKSFSSDSSSTFSLDPQKIPAMNLSANEFSYDNKNYGAVTVELQPMRRGLNIEKLVMKNSFYSLNLSGIWAREFGQDSSSFSGVLSTDNLGEMFKNMGVTDHISAGKGTANFSLSWPGLPSDFETFDLHGNVDINLSSGSIVGLDKAVNEKIGLGKILNILSLQSLANKLTLNFNDVSKDGFDFSTMKGNFVLENGNIYTQNGYVDGSVADLYISGTLGLKTQTYDLTLKINPYYTSSLPVIAGIAAGPIIGPVVGVATWAAGQAIHYATGKLSSYDYHVGGTWAEPVVTENK